MKEFQEKRILYEEVNDQEPLLEADYAILIDESEKSTDEKKKRSNKGHKEKKGRKEKKQKARTEIDKLLEMIAEMKSDCKDRIKKLERRTKEMIELVSALLKMMDELANLNFRNLTWFPYSKHVFPQQQLLA